MADKAVVLASGTRLETGDDITLTINLTGSDPSAHFITRSDGTVAGVVVGASKGTGALELNGSGDIGDVGGTGSLKVNAATQVDSNAVAAGSIGSAGSRFGDVSVGAHGGSLSVDQAYVRNVSLGEGASIASQAAVSASERTDLAQDARLEASSIELAGGSSSVLYGADGAEIGASSLELSSGSSACVKSSFDKRASVLAAGTLSFGNGSEAASLAAGRNGAIYIGSSYDLLGFSDVSNQLLGDDADKAKSLAIIDTPLDLGTTGGILLDGDLEATADPSSRAAAGTVTLRNGASIFLSSGSGASSSQSYISASSKPVSYSLDDTSSLYIRDAGAIGDVSGGSLFVNSEVSGTSSNMDVSMGNANVKELVLTGRLAAGDLTASEEINVNSGSTLTAGDIAARDLLIGNGGGTNVSLTADSITTTGLFSALDNGVNSMSISVSAGSITSSGQFRIEGQGARVESSGNILFQNVQDASVGNGATLAAGNAILINGSLKADNARIETSGLHLHGTLELSNGASFYSDADGSVSDDGDITNDSVINLGSAITDPSGADSVDQNSTKGRVRLAGSTFTAEHRAAVELFGTRSSTTGGAIVTYDNTQQFDLDAGSTLVISDLGEMTLDEVSELKARLFTDPSRGTLAGYTLAADPAVPGTDPSDPGRYAYDDVSKYDGTTGIADKLVEDIHGEIAGTKNFGAGRLSDGESVLRVSLGGNSLSLSSAQANGGKFATRHDGATADAAIGEGSYLQLNGTGEIGDITGNGTMQARNGAIKTGEVSVGAFDFTSGANVSAVSLSASGTGTITDSTATVSGDLAMGSAAVQNSSLSVGGTLTVNGTASLDPSYVYAGNIEIGSSGLLKVLKDTVVYNGMDQDYADSSSAVLVLNRQLDLSSGGKIYIDNSLENADASSITYSTLGRQVTVRDGQLVVTTSAVDSAGGEAVVKLAGDDQVEVDDNGSVVLYGFTSNGAQISLFDHATTLDPSDIASANPLYTATLSDDGQTVTYSLNSAGIASTSSGLVSGLRDAIVARAGSSDSDNNYFDSSEGSAVGYVSRALESFQASQSSAVRSLNTLASYSFASGSAQNALASSEAGYGAIEERAGFRAQNSSSIGEVKGHDLTAWATPLYRHQGSDSYDFDGGDYGSSTNLYGVAVGADMAFVPSFRAGVAAHVGSGKSESEGDLNYVKDEFDFYGASLYGVYQAGRFSLLCDAGYTYVDNDSEGSGFKASSFGTDVFAAGVNAKYAFQAGSVGIAPHLGVRYVSSHIDGYDVKADGVKYMGVGSITQNVVKFPLGVTFSTDVKAGDWTVRPVGDITVTAAAGDRDVDSDVTLVGFNGFSVNGDVVDPVSARASVGIDAQMGQSLGLGLGVAYTGSKNLNEASVSGSFRYTF